MSEGGGGLVVGYDLSSASSRRTGIGRYAMSLARALAQPNCGDLNLVSLFCSLRQPLPDVPGLGSPPRSEVVRRRIPGPLLHYSWKWFGGPAVASLLGRKTDVFHAPAMVVPPGAGCPVVATVHDLHFLQPGGDNSPLGGGYLRWVFEHRLSSVAAVIAVSHRTAEALKEATGWDGEGGRGPLIRDIPHGVDDVFLRRGKAAGGKGERGRPPCGLPRQYGLYVGSRVARKNLGELAFAWRILLDLGCDLPLVLAGPTRWPGGREPSGFAELRRRRRLHEVGFVDDATLAELFRGSSVVVLPSADEGFGLPVAEAMACGACVVCSPHVGALDYVLPGSVSVFDQAGGAAALAEAIGKVVGDSRLRAGMSAKALRSAEGFSWAECARETVGVYREVLGG